MLEITLPKLNDYTLGRLADYLGREFMHNEEYNDKLKRQNRFN